SLENLEIISVNLLYYCKKKDSSDYKVESVHNCYSALNIYLKKYSILQPIKIWDHYKFPHAFHMLNGKMKILQSKVLDDPEKSDRLSAKEIK
ncbi:15140_t:CDS:1, partial [Funneliformis mosseae]